MRKMRGHVTAVLGRVIIIGFGIQIVLGMLWMCSAFASLPGLREGIVCVGQIALAGCAGHFFLRSAGVGRGWLRLFGSLALVTFPMLMQCHMTADVRSVTASLILLETACVIRATGRPESRYFWWAALGFWMLAGLLLGEYFYFGAVPVIFLLVKWSFDPGQRGAIWRQIVLAAAVGGIIAGAGSFYQERQRPEACIASRFAWTTLYQTYSGWQEEWKDQIGYGTMVEACYEAVGIEKIMLPRLEETVGTGEAGRLMLEISGAAWRRDASRILKEIAWDELGYALPPAVLPLQLQGRAYDSYSGVNYRQILQPAPRLGKGYMDYSCWWFQTGLVLGALMLLLQPRPMDWKRILTALLTGGLMVSWYTMRGAGQMDYKNTAYVLCLWIGGMIVTAARGLGLSGGDADEKS